MLGVTSKIFPYSMIVAKNIKSAKDLVGGKLAVNRLADVSAIASQVALRKLGLNPDKDVTMLQVGGSPQRLAALQSGAVQAAAIDFMSGLRLCEARLPRAFAGELKLSLPRSGCVRPVLARKSGGCGGVSESFCRSASRASSKIVRKALKPWHAT